MTIQAIAFDTGGTVLDWHAGLHAAFERVGIRHQIKADWHTLTNDYRRLAMKGIMGQVQPAFNMDGAHRAALDEVLTLSGLQVLSTADRDEIFGAWRLLEAWQDFAPALAALKAKFPVVSFTMLPVSLVVAVSRRNGLNWDAVISCEMFGIYKPNPQAYLQVATWLGLQPEQILMVACHNFDLNAARACGFKTAFVKRPHEWGPSGPPDPIPHADCDIVADDFLQLARLIPTCEAVG